MNRRGIEPKILTRRKPLNLGSVFLTKVRDALAIAAMFGSAISCAYNLIVFEDWNVNYFQVASLGDVLISAISMAFVFLILLLILPLIYMYIEMLHVRFRKLSIYCRKKTTYKYRKSVRILIQYVYTYVICFALGALVVFCLYFWESEASLAPAINRLSSYDLIVIVISVIVIPFYMAGRIVSVGKRNFSIHSLFLAAYAVLWFSIFVSTDKPRWYGYIGKNHTEIYGTGLSGCSKIYILWLGERNTVVECWRSGLELKQQIFILSSGKAGWIGPIAADPAPMPPYSRNGPLPPPEDRMTDTMKKELELR